MSSLLRLLLHNEGLSCTAASDVPSPLLDGEGSMAMASLLLSGPSDGRGGAGGGGGLALTCSSRCLFRGALTRSTNARRHGRLKRYNTVFSAELDMWAFSHDRQTTSVVCGHMTQPVKHAIWQFEQSGLRSNASCFIRCSMCATPALPSPSTSPLCSCGSCDDSVSPFCCCCCCCFLMACRYAASESVKGSCGRVLRRRIDSSSWKSLMRASRMRNRRSTGTPS
mmetsp:Transcript_8449/g.24047  ORF Transcript_8449/g.24047 Transcript_8449/m.24047 type:complete len:224 (+) Transcript_8449:941-1612(+)